MKNDIDGSSNDALSAAAYLGPGARISLAWTSQATLPLILLSVTLVFTMITLNSLINDAKEQFISACTSLESGATMLVSLPHYLGASVNAVQASTIAKVVASTAEALDLALQALLQLILFFIDSYRSLLFCVVEFGIHSGADLLVSAAQEAETYLRTASTGISQEVITSVDTANTALKTALDSSGLFGAATVESISSYAIPVPNLTALNNVTLPSSILDDLVVLNNSLPDFKALKAELDELISAPIQSVRSQVASNLGNATFNVSQLPVPPKQTIELCSGFDAAFLDQTGRDLSHFAKAALGLVILAMFVVVSITAFLEWQRHRSLVTAVSYSTCLVRGILGVESFHMEREAWPGFAISDPPSLLGIAASVTHPFSTQVVARLANASNWSRTRQSSILWMVYYMSQPGPINLLLFGLVGLFVVQIELAVLEGPVQAAALQKAGSASQQISEISLADISSVLNLSSTGFAHESNLIIQNFEDELNMHTSAWTDQTMSSLNSTLNGFYVILADSLKSAFSNTVLQDPVLDLLYCIIGSKVDKISGALTWINNHSRIDLPRVSNGALYIDASDLTAPLSSSASPTSGINLVKKLIQSFSNGLKQQRWIFFICIALWMIALLSAVCGALFIHAQQSSHLTAGDLLNWENRRSHRRGKCTSARPALRPFRLKPSHDQSDNQKSSSGEMELNHSTRKPSNRDSGCQRSPAPKRVRVELSAPNSSDTNERQDNNENRRGKYFWSRVLGYLARPSQWHLRKSLANRDETHDEYEDECIGLKMGRRVDRSFPVESRIRMVDYHSNSKQHSGLQNGLGLASTWLPLSD